MWIPPANWTFLLQWGQSPFIYLFSINRALFERNHFNGGLSPTLRIGYRAIPAMNSPIPSRNVFRSATPEMMTQRE